MGQDFLVNEEDKDNDGYSRVGLDFLVNEEDNDNDGFLRVGLDFLESYSRAPATDYRRQVTPSHAKKTNIGKKCKKGMQQKMQKM